MSYELHVNAGVAGQQELDRLTQGTEKQKTATDRLNETLYGLKGATEKNTEAQLKYLTQLSKTEEWTLKYKIATMGATEATDRQTQAVARMGNAHGAAVTQIQATSGALRTLEGSMPIRAAERFLTLVPGIGTALQAIFPVVGAFAMAEVLARSVKEVQHLKESWDPVIQAQKTSLELQRQINRELETNSDRLRSSQITHIGLTQGPAAAMRAQAKDLEEKARTSDQAGIYVVQRQIDVLQKLAGHQLGPFWWEQPGIGLSAQEVGILRSMPGGKPGESGFNFGKMGDPGAGNPLMNAAMGPGLIQAAQQRLIDTRGELTALQREQQADVLGADNLRRQAQQTETAAGTREKAQHDRIDLEARKKSLAELRKSWDDIEKAVDKAAKNFSPILGPLAEGQSRYRLSEDAALYGIPMPRLKDVAELTRELDQSSQQLTLGRDRLDLALGPMDTPAPPGPSISQQRRDLRLNASRTMRGIASNDVEGKYQARLQIAQQEYDLDVKDAAAKHNLQEKEDALNQMVEKRYDATIEREQAIAEMIERQKQAFEQNVLGLIEAARSGRAGSFIRSKLEKAGEDMLAKLVLGPVFDKISGVGRPKTVSIHDVIGDAAKDATTQNTTATEDNTRAVDDLTDAIRGLTNYGGMPVRLPRGVYSGPGASGGPFVLNGFPSNGLPDSGLVTFGMPSSGGVGQPSGGGSGTAGMGGGGGSKGGQVATYAAAAFGVYEGIKNLTHPGARNKIAGVGELAGSAALVDPEPISKAILSGVALGSGLVSAVLGDPRAARAHYIQHTLEHDAWMQPVAINASMSTGGTYSDFDRFGGVRSSNLSPFPSVQQGYFDYRYGATVPGRTVSSFGGPQPSLSAHFTIQSMDGADVERVLNNHAGHLMGAMTRGLQLGSGDAVGLRDELRR